MPRAHGRETTFQEDLEDWDRIAEEVRTLTRQVVADIDKEGRPAARVGLKLRYRPFITISRSLTLPEPSNDPEHAGRRGGDPAGASRAGPAGAAARRPARDGAARGRLLVPWRRSSPDSIANTTSWARSRACSFTMARETWVRTVSGLTTRTSAISWLDRPVATQATTSRSRSVSWSELGMRSTPRRGRPELLDHPAGHARRQEGAAVGDDTYGVEQRAWGRRPSAGTRWRRCAGPRRRTRRARRWSA